MKIDVDHATKLPLGHAFVKPTEWMADCCAFPVDHGFCCSREAAHAPVPMTWREMIAAWWTGALS